MGIECWCWAWCDNPKRASEGIVARIRDARARGDSDSERSLRMRWLRINPTQELAERRKRDLAHEEQRRQFSAPKERDPAVWESFRLEFERLADAELKRYPQDQIVSISPPKRSWLCAFTYAGPEEDCGDFYGIGGGADERFKEAFTRTAVKAGIALGSKASENGFLDWLTFVFFDCREHKTKLLQRFTSRESRIEIPEIDNPYPINGIPFRATGIISRICEASALACSHLERQALEQQALERLSARTPSAPKKPKPLKPPSGRNMEIYSVIQRRLAGSAYCRAVDALGVEPSPKSKWMNWPGTYEGAYKKDEVWRERIRKEKDRVKRRVQKYLRLSGESWEELARKLKFSSANPV